MKYRNLIDYIKKSNVEILDKSDIYQFYFQIYNNSNIRSFENVITYLKSNNIINEIEKDKYILVTKNIYLYNESDEEKKIYNVIKKEYPEIDFIIWNTQVINEFTLHYAINNYIIIEVEKIAVELIVNLLKSKYLKKYTVITQDMFNNYKEMFLNTENFIIVKSLHTKSPLNTNADNKYVSIEKIMVDLYVDKLYIQFQGRELKIIYQNIFNNYDINMKRLIKYAEYRVDLKEYKEYINSLDIPEKYKLKVE